MPPAVNSNVPNGLPRGGVCTGVRTAPWRWDARRPLRSSALRCRRDQWYLLCASGDDVAGDGPPVVVEFLDEHAGVLLRRCLSPAPRGEAGGSRVAWFQSPKTCATLRLVLPDAAAGALPRSIVVHAAAERDPKCHPLANVPRWSTHRPPFPIERVFASQELADTLASRTGLAVEALAEPASLKQLARRIQGSACVLAGAWAQRLGWTFADIEKLASLSWLIVDLETGARLVTAAGRAVTRVVTHADEHGLMSARVEYSDAETGGFALQDVLPFGWIDTRGRFATRVLRRSATWRRFADRSGFATLLASETPWVEHTGDVLTAAAATGAGELVFSDVPWLAARRFGPLFAPRLMQRLLRAHLGQPVPDHLQYWNRWDDETIVLRDLADLERRYPPLRTARWAGPPTLAHVGIELPAPSPRLRLVIRTGRIDQRDAHDGLPPEPMAIFMKWLAREVRERSAWALRHLDGVSVCWQFDCAAGLRYALHYHAADASRTPTRTLVLRRGRDGAAAPAGGNGDGRCAAVIAVDDGLFGDGSFDVQERLTSLLRGWIECGGGAAQRA
ncbi:MAG: hypothetical protein LC135_17295 [Phycisphaerae bacterium]|jgi:hypothetical protein|nr:hypothetical protein [Phycisphaerae bacterium]MCZ2401596.1 hypothetical protein [Phycisphaerae bacterium]